MRRRTAVTLVATLLLAGCASIERHPVPIEAMDQAIIPGMPGVRDWGDEVSEHFQADVVQAAREAREAEGTASNTSPVNVLVLSGGGSNGAFGAGILAGWTEAGTRPSFRLVTGVSTGALIAPFAFLGPVYDAELEEAFTNVTRKDIYRIRNPLAIFKKDSLARTDPLARQIEQLINQELLQAVAAEHRRGRRLFIGTTNLDAQRLVVWNMGAIAASDQPGSLDLFRDVLLASASIPVAFPPVYIDVEVDGRRFDEMHVDGGVTAELFLWGAMVDIADTARELQIDIPPIAIYIIRNGPLQAVPEQVDPKLVDIASRSMLTLLNSIAMGDLVRIWTQTEGNGVDFNYVGIPPEQPETPTASFKPQEMRRLFELGRALALEPDTWRTKPPAWLR
jgi:predicted patatin/cPLA2 family phospholipase